jgi:transcriptional regulator with XRE-family HTH domain
MDNGIEGAQTARDAFAERLVQALKDNGHPLKAYTLLVRGFNRRSGMPAITVHAARKWLLGESIPTQARLAVLAAWLGVSAEWLRYGAVSASEPHHVKEHANSEDLLLLADISTLSKADKSIVSALVESLMDKRR